MAELCSEATKLCGELVCYGGIELTTANTYLSMEFSEELRLLERLAAPVAQRQEPNVSHSLGSQVYSWASLFVQCNSGVPLLWGLEPWINLIDITMLLPRSRHHLHPLTYIDQQKSQTSP